MSLDVSNLMRRKKEILVEMLKITTLTELSGNSGDAERYVDLMGKREDLLKKLVKLDTEIKQQECKGDDALLQKELEQLNAEIADVAGKIVEQDKKMANDVLAIMNELKGKLRGISAGKSINSTYQQSSFLGDGVLFDSKQ